ncbi:MAG: hypothetical protein RLZZ435_1905 [Cyanobacteriota bacterium]|jgi:hypothetical protein
MIESFLRKFKISKLRLRTGVGLILATFLILFWLVPSNPFLFENPSWLFSRPSDEIILKSLPSKKNIDYRPLRSLLQTQQWEKADRETQEKIAQLLGSFSSVPELNPLLRFWFPKPTYISKIPCTDLLTIDLLWTTFSEGRFGINVQRQIVENDSRLSSPEEIKQICLRQCPQEIPNTIEKGRCKMSCESQRIEAQFERIPAAMGRGHSTVVNPLPAGYYPSPIEVRNHEADAYRELAQRANRCHV